MVSLFKDIIPSLNLKTEHLMDNNKMTESQYDAFNTNKAYSFGEDIMIANAMNLAHHLPNRLQYDFYFYGLDKQKRYDKWIKKHNINTIDIIQKYCGCSYKRALEYSLVISDQQLDKIKKSNDSMEDNVSK